tara:strand:+ start:515 stop:790 length:276 start_codon:yes stop_codon:yes gene_type:complete
MKVKLLSNTQTQGGTTATTVADTDGIGATYVRISNVSAGVTEVQIRDTSGGAAVHKTYVAPYESLIIKKSPSQFVYGNSSSLYFAAVAPNP